MVTIPISSSATQSWLASMSNYSRVLILGGGGWFGRTSLLLLSNSPLHVLAVGSRGRKVEVGPKSHAIGAWNLAEIQRFSPDLVLDFAFLTRGYLGRIGVQDYIEANEALTAQLREVVSLSSVRAVFSISSGLVSMNPGDPYARGKARAEQALMEERQSNDFNLVIARAWSVSGSFVRNPDEYALSSFVRQGLDSGKITVSADRLVYRRYCAVEELLAVGLFFTTCKPFHLLDSGGERIEIGKLAESIARRIPGAWVDYAHPERASRGSDAYLSDNKSWRHGLQKSQVTPMTIGAQIDNVIASFRSR